MSNSQYTLEEQAVNRQKLVMALREPMYQSLVVDGKFNPDGYSFPSVALEVSGLFDERDRDNYLKQFPTQLSDISESVRDWLGFTTNTGRYLDQTCIMHHLSNQWLELSFVELADIIEADPIGLKVTQETIPTWFWRKRLEVGDIWEIVKPDINGPSYHMVITREGEGFCLKTVKTTYVSVDSFEKALGFAKNRAGWHGRVRHVEDSNERLLIVT